jgi:hypothetical protein
MLFNHIQGQRELTQQQAITKYWGGEIESVPHPKYRYGCEVHPHGWTEITQEEFAQSNFFRYTPLATGWSRTLAGDAFLYFMHDDTGFALIGDYWEKKVSIFKFGCQHDSTSEEVGRCLTKYTCKKCGFVQTIDSSD